MGARRAAALRRRNTNNDTLAIPRRDAARRRPRARRLSGSILPKQPDKLALNAHTVRRQNTDLVRAVGGLQRDRSAAAPEALERSLFVVDQRDHDIARVGAVTLADQHRVAVENAGIDHRVAAHLKREMLAS